MNTKTILIDALRDFDDEKAQAIVALYDSHWRFSFVSEGRDFDENGLYGVTGHLTEKEAIDDCLDLIWNGIVDDTAFYEGKPFRVRIRNETAGFEKEIRVVFRDGSEPEISYPDEPDGPGL